MYITCEFYYPFLVLLFLLSVALLCIYLQPCMYITCTEKQVRVSVLCKIASIIVFMKADMYITFVFLCPVRSWYVFDILMYITMLLYAYD